MKCSKEFEASLQVAKSMTVEDLMVAVDSLPNSIKNKLAEGPHPSRYVCGVCEAFGDEFYKKPVEDNTDPVWLAFAYHEIPKLEMVLEAQQFYGRLANEVYVRCIETYKAAGWTGEAEEANA
jgi:hypothetical protein